MFVLARRPHTLALVTSYPTTLRRISAPAQGLGIGLIETEGTKVFVHVRRILRTPYPSDAQIPRRSIADWQRRVT